MSEYLTAAMGAGGAAQARLLPLLARQAALYTMDDHSSVPMETAQELLHSICFTIGLHLDTLPPEAVAATLAAEDWTPLLAAGRAEITRRLGWAEGVLGRVEEDVFPRESLSYTDTLGELRQFFRRYDGRYFAHDVPCMIDYQLANGLPEGEGITFLCAYLRALAVENAFCRRFDPQMAQALLAVYSPQWRELLVNLYEPLAVNALGLTLLGGDVFALDVSQEGRRALLRRFSGWSPAERAMALQGAADQLCAAHSPPEMVEYLRQTAHSVDVRVGLALPGGDLSNIFLSFL